MLTLGLLLGSCCWVWGFLGEGICGGCKFRREGAFVFVVNCGESRCGAGRVEGSGGGIDADKTFSVEHVSVEDGQGFQSIDGIKLTHRFGRLVLGEGVGGGGEDEERAIVVKQGSGSFESCALSPTTDPLKRLQ